MMRQPGLGAAVSIQTLLGDANPNRQRVPYDIVDDDRVQVLSSSKKKGLPKGEKLKRYLYDVVAARGDILKLADDPQTNLRDTVAAIIDKELRNKTVIDRMKKNELSTAVVSLFDIMTVLEDRSMVKQHITRGRKRTPLQKVFYDFTSLKERIDGEIVRMLNDAERDKLLKGMALTPQAKSLRFHPSCVPQDPAHQRCLFCLMMSLNVCVKNGGMEARNDTKLQRYSAKMVVWDRHLQMKKATEDSGDPPPPCPLYNGEQLKRKPQKPGAHNG